jgi:hypothetical protein
MIQIFSTFAALGEEYQWSDQQKLGRVSEVSEVSEASEVSEGSEGSEVSDTRRMEPPTVACSGLAKGHVAKRPWRSRHMERFHEIP